MTGLISAVLGCTDSVFDMSLAHELVYVLVARDELIWQEAMVLVGVGVCEEGSLSVEFSNSVESL